MLSQEPRRLRIKSVDTGSIYELTFVNDAIYCSCPHFQYRLRRGQTCKHIDQWVAENISAEERNV